MKPQVYKDDAPGGVLRPVPRRGPQGASAGPTRFVRVIVSLPTLLIYRVRAIGVENVPRTAPLVLAPNHFSQMDHFFVGVYLRRKIRFMAKSQLFGPPVLTYIYKHGGVFPVRRGHHDEEAFKTAYDDPRPGRDAARLRRGRPLALAASWASRNRGSAGSRWNPARRSSRSRSTARRRCARWKRLRFPKVTVQFGEPLTFPVEPDAEPRAPARGRRPRSSPGCGRCTSGLALLVAGVELRRRTPDRARA